MMPHTHINRTGARGHCAPLDLSRLMLTAERKSRGSDEKDVKVTVIRLRERENSVSLLVLRSKNGGNSQI